MKENIEIFGGLVATKNKEQSDARVEQVAVLNQEIKVTQDKMTDYISKVDIDNLILKDTSPNEALDTLKKQKKKFDDS